MDLAAARGCASAARPIRSWARGRRTARRPIDDRAIGRPVAGTAFFMSRTRALASRARLLLSARRRAVLDMGPYYITDLISCWAPSAASWARSPGRGSSVSWRASRSRAPSFRSRSRRCRAAGVRPARRRLDRHELDVPKHNHAPIKDHQHRQQRGGAGSETGSAARVTCRPGEAWQAVPHTHGNVDGEFRSIGVAGLAAAIALGRPHRASGALALHALEAMEAFEFRNEGRRVKLRNDRRASRHDDSPRPADRPDGLCSRLR